MNTQNCFNLFHPQAEDSPLRHRVGHGGSFLQATTWALLAPKTPRDRAFEPRTTSSRRIRPTAGPAKSPPATVGFLYNLVYPRGLDLDGQLVCH